MQQPQPDQLDPQTRADLDVARRLAAAGIPLFIAHPDASVKTGFTPPRQWQLKAKADPAVVDQWRPGLALCAVMGHGLDLVDIDPRAGGDASVMNGSTPHVHGVAATPSGGQHLFIASIGTGSRDGVFQGIDLKSGTPEGTGHGFAFLAPTVRASVVTGERSAYRWTNPPGRIPGRDEDHSGDALAERVRALRAETGAVRKLGGPEWWQRFMLDDEPHSVAIADRAIEAKLAEVTGWTVDGGENFRTTLLRAALTLGGYVGGGHIDEDDARTQLLDAAATVWGSPDAHDELWIAQGLDDGALYPFHTFTPEQERQFNDAAVAVAGEGEDEPGRDVPLGPDVAGNDTEPPWNVFAVLGGEPFDPAGDGTDQGLAKAVAYRMYPALRYGGDAGTWIKRERDVWAEAGDDMSDWIVGALAELMPLGQLPVPKDPTDRTDLHWQAHRRGVFMSSAGASKVARKLRAIVRSDHPATVKVGELDSNPEIIWAGAVPWDLRRCGDVPTPADWIDPNTPHLRAAWVAPDPTVPTPRWDAFLAAVLPDPEVRAWALRVLSIALTGHADAALPVLYGRERSGKTSLVESLVTVLGSYAHAADAKLLSSADNSHASIVYALKGRRLSFIDEGPKRGHDATERLKQLTGGGSLTANQMRANPITFRPTHTLVMTTNNEPQLTDPALRARMRLIPCDEPEATVRPARVPLLGAGLRTEAPGILAAMMREAAAYLADRDSASTAAAPISIRGMGEAIATAQDPVREWIANCTVPADPGTPGRALYTAFAGWHQSSPLYRRMSVPTETSFGRSLTEAGYPSQKQAGAWYRPLSVLSGPSGVAPWEPMTDPFMVRGAEAGSGTVAGPMAGPGGFAAGPESRPANAENSSSGAVFTSGCGGLAGNTPIPHTTINNPHTQGNTADKGAASRQPAPTPVPAPTETGPDLGVSGPVAGGGWTPPPSRQEPAPVPPASDPAPAPSDPAPAAPEGADQSQSVTESSRTGTGAAERNAATRETARIATEEGITKAEARKRLKDAERAEKIRAAITEAGGELHPLPVVVNRAGTVLPLEHHQARRVIADATARAGALTVDVETTGYPVGHPEFALRLVQLGDDAACVVLDPDDSEQVAIAAEALAAAPVLHAHSATADLVPCARAGMLDYDEAWTRMVDTAVLAKLADPAYAGDDPGLKDTARAVLGEHAVSPGADEARAALFKAGKWLTNTDASTDPARSGWTQVPRNCATFLRYGASDVLDTAAIPRALPRPEHHVLERERTAERMTARITSRGVRLDPEHVAVKSAEAREGQAQAGARVREFGIDNPGSADQVAAVFDELGVALPRTKPSGRHPHGKTSVAVAALDRLKGDESTAGRLAASVLDYRHHSTVLGLFLEPYRELCERGDGRARPTVYTLGTDTGRMSCTRPNLQQLSREGGIRACITADPGQLMIGADFSGVELRVAAALSQDPTLLRFLAEDRDLHEEVALQVWGQDPAATAKAGRPAPLKAHRYIAKRIVFGRIYGGGLETLAAQAGVSLDVAQLALDALDLLTPGLSAWSRDIRRAVQNRHTRFPTYSGRVIHLPQAFPHKAPNYCIQGTARELLVDTLIRWESTPWADCSLFPVHDELDLFVPAEDAADATAALVACMETELHGVKIVADPSDPSPFWPDSV